VKLPFVSVVVAALLLSSCTTPTPTGTIAFSSTRDGNPEIYLINADATGLERLTHGPYYDSNPVFSADGQHIAFNSVVDGELDVYVMHKDGSPAINLTDSPGDDGSPPGLPTVPASPSPLTGIATLRSTSSISTPASSRPSQTATPSRSDLPGPPTARISPSLQTTTEITRSA
jgi:hypothetical protein